MALPFLLESVGVALPLIASRELVGLTVALVVEWAVFARRALAESEFVAVEAVAVVDWEVAARERMLHSRLQRKQDEELHLPAQPNLSLVLFVHFELAE